MEDKLFYLRMEESSRYVLGTGNSVFCNKFGIQDKASALKYLASLASLASRLPIRHRRHRLEGTCQHSGVTRQR